LLPLTMFRVNMVRRIRSRPSFPLLSSPNTSKLPMRQLKQQLHQPSRNFISKSSTSRGLFFRYPSILPIFPKTRIPKRLFNSAESMDRGVPSRVLRQLEQVANEAPHDPEAQLAFLRALNKSGRPEHVIRRLNSGKYSVNAGVMKEYSNASRRIQQAANRAVQEDASYGSPHNPMHVRYVDSNGMAQAAPGGTMVLGAQAAQQSSGGVGDMLGKLARFTFFGFIALWLLEAYVMPSDKDASQPNGGGGIAGSGGSGITGGMGDMASRIMGGKTPRVVEPEESDKRFTDVQGVAEAKAELEEIVEYLKNPGKFSRLGGKLPKGVLLMGAPGTGKTLLAKAIAGEAGVPFFYASGSEFEEMFVGVGARRIRDLFNAAKQRRPCIIFIDEIDAVGGKRGPKDQAAIKMTLNQLLTEMDGFDTNEGVIVIGATNYPSALDKALVRPGRFDRHVQVPLPDVKGRTDILGLYLDQTPTSKDVSAKILARGTPGLSGAELFNIVNTAALRASTQGQNEVTMKDLEWAKDKVLMGAERKSAVISEENKKTTAYHEGGHAVVALYTKGALPIHKATIMPRGQALGMVMQLPEGDMLSQSFQQMNAELDVCMGGRAAEELIFGAEHVTSGASSDLQRATNLARRMVCLYGFSPLLGTVRYTEDDMKHLSPQTKETIDAEVKRILDESYQRAMTCLKEHARQHENLSQALIKYETLTKDQIMTVIEGRALPQTENMLVN